MFSIDKLDEVTKESYYNITSEIHVERDYRTKKTPNKKGNIVSEFPFTRTLGNGKEEALEIEHSASTPLLLVGLQVWRPCLLLADMAMSWGETGLSKGMNVLELGAGVGFASMAAGMHVDKVVCTDIHYGGILDLMKVNVHRNKDKIKSKFVIKEIDFTKELADDVIKELENINVIFGTDLIYGEDLTAGFLALLERLLNMPPKKEVFISLDKRYDYPAPNVEPAVCESYENFLVSLKKMMKPQWKMEQIALDFPQYFAYQRTKDLALWKISS